MKFEHDLNPLEVFEGMLANMPLIVFEIDQTGVFQFSRGRGLQSLDLNDNQVRGMHYAEIYGHLPDIVEMIEAALSGQEFNRKVYVNDSYFHVFLRQTSRQTVMGFALEETELASAKQETSKLVNQLLIAYEISREGMWSWNLRTNQVQHNERWREIFEYDDLETSTQLEAFTDRVHPADLPRVWQGVEKAIQAGTTFEHSFRLITPSGEKVVQDRGRVVHWDLEGNPLFMIGSVNDITQQMASQKALEHKASTDDLTGLNNRFGSEVVWTNWQNSASHKPSKVVFALLDFDHFQPVNHVLGYALGNKVLQQFAQGLKNFLPSNIHLSRIGGDEFLLMAPNLPLSSLQGLLKNFSEQLQKPVKNDAINTKIQFSCGFSKYPKDGDEFATLFQRAEAALHQAKKAGRNCFKEFDIEYEKMTAQRFSLLTKLQNALQTEQLYYQLQPQYDLQQQTYTGAEVLIRWQDAQLGFVSPVEFIPIAEQAQLITPITYWLVEKVINDIDLQAKYRPVNFKYSINIPAQFLAEPDLVSWILFCLNKPNIDAQNLCFEVTESQLLSDSDNQWRTNIELLRQQGIEFAVDDFGTGYSNLSQLKRLDFSTLKIDKSFIDALDLTMDTTGHALVKAMIGLAHTLKMDLIAEGVETPRQVAWLQAHGCHKIQGYYFSKPLDTDDFVEFIKLHNPS